MAGGRKSDSQLTIESGLIELVKDGDIILVDKGFPQISACIDDSGQKVLVVMPPFLEQKNRVSSNRNSRNVQYC